MLTTTTLSRHHGPMIVPQHSIAQKSPVVVSQDHQMYTCNHQKSGNVDYHSLVSGVKFTEKSHIKPWLHAKLVPNGVHIVIERSDDTKIVFKCKESKRKNNKQKKRAQTTEVAFDRPPCPFRIRANYSIRIKHWSLVVVNDNHNHEIISPPVLIRPVLGAILTPTQSHKEKYTHNMSASLKNVPFPPAIQPASTLSTSTLTSGSISSSSSGISLSSALSSTSSTPKSSVSGNSAASTNCSNSPNLYPIPMSASSSCGFNTLPAITRSISNNNNYTSNRSITLPPMTGNMPLSRLPVLLPPLVQNDNTLSNSVTNMGSYEPLSLHYHTQPTPLVPVSKFIVQPPIQLIENHQHRIQRIEDSLKHLNSLDSLTHSSKEKILNNVLNVLNSSIEDAKK